MKKSILLLTSLLCFALTSASLHAALSYWDSNGPEPGAGSAPTGLWSTDPAFDNFWTSSSTGTGTSNTWMAGDTAVFSAGDDATNDFVVYVYDPPYAPDTGGLIFEEGQVTLSGGSINMTNEFAFPVTAYTNATIDSALASIFGIGECGVWKTGPGRVALGGSSGYSGTNIVIEGTLASSSAGGLGSTFGPTVVSNGATLEAASSTPIGEVAIIHGNGVANAGALRNTGTTPQSGGWTGGVLLGSDAKIGQDSGNTWTFSAQAIIGTNAAGDFNLTFGGNGSAIRLNSTIPLNRCVNLGTGSMIKAGTCLLRFENAAIAHDLYWLDGDLMSRWGGNFIQQDVYAGPPAPIYVGPLADRIRTGGSSTYTLSCLIVLSNGANPQIDCTAAFTSSGRITGEGGLIKRNTGTVTLNGWQDYLGGTLMSNGIVVLDASGTLTNSTPITVLAPCSFDVTAQPGGFTLMPSQTLRGDGTILGDVIADGTVAAGGSIESPDSGVGTLTFNTNLTINGNVSIDVNKALSPASGMITVLGTLCTNTGTGTLTVANIGGIPLAAGDSFQVFSQPLLNGEALTIASAEAVTWTNKLAIDGTIGVLSAPAPQPAQNMSVMAAGPGSMLIGGTGAANSLYGVYSSTNVTTPMASWPLIGNTISDGTGVIQFVDPQATEPEKYYRFGQ